MEELLFCRFAFYSLGIVLRPLCKCLDRGIQTKLSSAVLDQEPLSPMRSFLSRLDSLNTSARLGYPSNCWRLLSSLLLEAKANHSVLCCGSNLGAYTMLFGIAVVDAKVRLTISEWLANFHQKAFEPHSLLAAF